MATIWERAVHSVNHMFSLLCQFVILVASHLGLEAANLVLIAPVPGHCLPFTFEVGITYFELRTSCFYHI